MPQIEQIIPEHGIVTLFGYNASASVDRGHLIVTDGIGMNRRHGQFARVRHGLKRLVVIGSSGMVTFEALRWLADQRAAFVMLDRNGSVLSVSGPVGPNDARLRRAQSLAHQTDVAVQISLELISQKIHSQAKLLREHLGNSAAADTVADVGRQLKDATNIKSIRQVEAVAAQTYWAAWRDIPVNFPTNALNRTPDHWRVFGTRKSPITGSPRLAVNPPNAMLNYMYALLESEARLAAAALGLDPGIGFIHVDTDARDSLACDLMEPIRPQVDQFLLKWISNQPLKREWFFEKRDGSCRLMAPLASKLSETLPAWRQVLAPVAEWVSRTLWNTFKHTRKWMSAPTPLTQTRRRDGKGKAHQAASIRLDPPRLCRTCGKPVTQDSQRCSLCKVAVCTEELIKAARKGRIAAHTPDAERKRGDTRIRHAAAIQAWDPIALPRWLDKEAYSERIQPKLYCLTVLTLHKALGISKVYATHIRTGKRVPHPRHWNELARLVGEFESMDP